MILLYILIKKHIKLEYVIYNIININATNIKNYVSWKFWLSERPHIDIINTPYKDL